MNTIKIVCISLLVGFLFSCSANQIQLQSQIVSSIAEDTDTVFVLKEEVIVKASNVKATTLKAGTRWSKVGSIDKGAVYCTKDQVVIVNSFNVHEGYIVVDQDKVVGYYLPIENTFIQSKPTSINFSIMETQHEN